MGRVGNLSLTFQNTSVFFFHYLVSAIIPAPMIWFWPGAAWFHQGQIPSIASSLSSSDSLYGSAMDPRTVLSLWHLGNCKLGLIIDNQLC